LGVAEATSTIPYSDLIDSSENAFEEKEVKEFQLLL
tara:strand:- start:15 stop:122 length:108 start_codon:yes stop_codon:yes gene_type:complete